MRVAAYQAPLLPAGSMRALDLMRERVRWCQVQGVALVCFPEAILGGLADYNPQPLQTAFRTDDGNLESVLSPLASSTVTAIIGFTELAHDGGLYNAAAVLQQGRVAGLYRKLHPAIRRSVYAAGSETPVFRCGALTFGVVLCNDSNYSEPARLMAAQGATVLFVPTNNALPKSRACAGIVREARSSDSTRAVENRMWIVRADVAGENDKVLSYGCSAITDPSGKVVQQAERHKADMLIADIETSPSRSAALDLKAVRPQQR